MKSTYTILVNLMLFSLVACDLQSQFLEGDDESIRENRANTFCTAYTGAPSPDDMVFEKEEIEKAEEKEKKGEKEKKKDKEKKEEAKS